MIKIPNEFLSIDALVLKLENPDRMILKEEELNSYQILRADDFEIERAKDLKQTQKYLNGYFEAQKAQNILLYDFFIPEELVLQIKIDEFTMMKKNTLHGKYRDALSEYIMNSPLKGEESMSEYEKAKARVSAVVYGWQHFDSHMKTKSDDWDEKRRKYLREKN